MTKRGRGLLPRSRARASPTASENGKKWVKIILASGQKDVDSPPGFCYTIKALCVADEGPKEKS
jgi:hypothetical protein